jgi:PEP-CTERM motif
MRTARALLAMVALAAVIGWSSAAMATTFDIEVTVGFVDATGTCSAGNTCLGFAGGDATTSTRLNWDNATAATDSYLGIGALPSAIGFPDNVGNVGSIPTGTATGTITDDLQGGGIIQTAQIRHTNNVIPDEDNDLATIQLDTNLTLSSGGQVILDLPFSTLVSFLETTNTAPCTQTTNTLGSICDDQFTFNENIGTLDIPFSFGGEDFILHVRGLVNADNSFACEPGAGTTLNCLTAEGQVNDRFVIAFLENVTQVPAPATLLLLGLGLVGVGALPLIRKRRSA